MGLSMSCMLSEYSDRNVKSPTNQDYSPNKLTSDVTEQASSTLFELLSNELLIKILEDESLKRIDAISVRSTCKDLKNAMDEVIKKSLSITQAPTKDNIFLYTNFIELQKMGLSEEQIRSISPDILKNVLNDYNEQLPSEILAETDRFQQDTGISIDLSNTTLSLGKLCKVIQLIINSGKVSTLTHLYLPRNQLKALPASIGKLTALQSLELSNNQLSAIPDSIGKLTALQRLHFSDNQLIALPESIGQLTALRLLYLNNNPFTDEVKLKILQLCPQVFL